MTFSIVANCHATGMIGIAISSSSPAVAARCVHVRAGVGAVATQNITDPALGYRGLELMATGHSAGAALAELQASPHIAFRQLVLVDSHGTTAVRSGDRTLGVHAEARGEGVAAAGNLLASTAVPQRMVEAYLVARGPLPERLLQALEAGLAAGGEAGPVHSAGLVVVEKVAWPVVDLRVDWHEAPVARLRKLWTVYAPQQEDYVRRALDPEAAPSYGVPGEG